MEPLAAAAAALEQAYATRTVSTIDAIVEVALGVCAELAPAATAASLIVPSWWRSSARSAQRVHAGGGGMISTTSGARGSQLAVAGAAVRGSASARVRRGAAVAVIHGLRTRSVTVRSPRAAAW